MGAEDELKMRMMMRMKMRKEEATWRYFIEVEASELSCRPGCLLSVRSCGVGGESLPRIHQSEIGEWYSRLGIRTLSESMRGSVDQEIGQYSMSMVSCS